jgi:hypothetical protein
MGNFARQVPYSLDAIVEPSAMCFLPLYYSRFAISSPPTGPMESFHIIFSSRSRPVMPPLQKRLRGARQLVHGCPIKWFLPAGRFCEFLTSTPVPVSRI